MKQGGGREGGRRTCELCVRVGWGALRDCGPAAAGGAGGESRSSLSPFPRVGRGKQEGGRFRRKLSVWQGSPWTLDSGDRWKLNGDGVGKG